MYWNLLSVFVIVCDCFFCLEQFWRCWVQKHSSFVCRLNGYRAQLSHNFRRLRGFGLSAGGPGKAAWGNTPLHLAARNGHVAAAELLLSKGAAVDAKDNYGPGPPEMGSRAWNRVSDLGTSVRRFFRDCIFRNDMICRWKHKSSDGPLSNIVQSINGKLFWMSSLASLMDPSFWRRGPVCYQIPDGIWPMSGHVSMNDQSSKWFRIVSANLHRMSLTSSGAKLKWNGLSCVSPEGRPDTGSTHW